MASASHPRLGDLLVERGKVARAAVESAVAEARAAHRRLGEILIEQGLVEEIDVYRALAVQRGMEMGPLEELVRRLDLQVVEKLPRGFLERNHVLPIGRDEREVVVITSNPDAEMLEIEKAFHAQRVRPLLVTPSDYRRLWMLVDVRRGSVPQRRAGEAPPGLDLLGSHAEAHHVALFDALLLEAIAERASDLHVERYADEVRVRLRVDGDLRALTRITITPDELTGLINVVKVTANLDIAERRVPQGGRIRKRAGERVFDLRVQTQPSLWSEHVVIRILAQDTRLLTIEELGFPPALAQSYRRLLDTPGGLILIVGPTGSGKSTTLYAGLEHVARDVTRKVITIEDPVEYAVSGVQQAQVRPDIGFAFADAMRAFVREDPDVILVGEIRDSETALEAIRASQTGHLVLSTLHCNDATDAVQRLLDLGQHPNSVASELSAVVAQRLVKRVCPKCRAPAEPEPHILAELFPRGAPAGFVCFQGKGCPACDGHGTVGRIAVIEYLPTGPAIRRAIARRAPSDDIRAIALREGLVSMRTTALWLINDGVVPLSEMPWVLSAERMGEGEGGGARDVEKEPPT